MIKLYVEGPRHQFAPGAPRLKGIIFVYAHGILGDKAGYDLIAEDANARFDKRRVINGEEVVAVLPDGTEEKALLFFWHSRDVYTHKGWNGEYKQIYLRPHGLLVAKKDKRGVKYARQCIESRQNWL